jgi:glycosyltransferase involved in cell wall biosynthesis
VLPSTTETLGLVLLEAMASGCPVVACRAGGVPDAVQDGLTGFLFEPADTDGLVNTVKRALASHADIEAIRLQARQDVEQRSWEGATEQLRQLYLETIQKGLPRKPQGPKSAVKRITSRLILGTLRTLLP